MLKINDKEIKFKRSLTEFFKKTKEINKVENIFELRKMFSTDLDDENLLMFLNFLKDYGKIAIKYIEKVDNDFFNEESFLKYNKFTKENPSYTNSCKIWKVIFGEEEANKRISKIRKNVISPFKEEYWIKKGFSKEESLKKIEEHQIKCGTKLENFVKRYGEEEGKKRFEIFRNKSKHTLDTFKNKYGEVEGKEKYEEYLKTKDSNSYEWALKKTNGNIKEAEKILKERKKSVIITLEKYIEKYGDVDLAKEKIREINLKKDSSSFLYFLNKNKGNREKAIKEYSERSLKKDCMSINFFLKKANGNLELAKKLQESEVRRRNVSFFTASKESLIYFIPLYKHLRRLNIKREDIFLGVNGSYEYLIHDLDNNKTYGYDFTVKNLNIIFEYHGEKFHPNIEKYTYEQLKEKNDLIFKERLDELLEKDKIKEKLAIENGFKYVVLWSSDSEEVNKNKILNALKNK